MDANLLRHPIFRGAEVDALADVLGTVGTRWIAKSTTLASPGSGQRAVILVLEGQLRSFLLTPDGRRVILELVGPGGIDGLLPTVGLTGHFTEAVQRSLVATLSPVQFDRLIRADPTVAVNLVTTATRRLAVREYQLESMAVRDPGRRIAAQLLFLARTSGERDPGRQTTRLRHGLTHQVIADMSAVRRETVTLHMQRLTEAGAVQSRGDHLAVEPEVLAAIVAGALQLASRRPRRSNGRDAQDEGSVDEGSVDEGTVDESAQ